MANAPDPIETVIDSRPEDELGLAPGDTVGRYVLSHRLGAGGMGVVFLAFDPQLERRLAIKLFLPRSKIHGLTIGAVESMGIAPAEVARIGAEAATIDSLGLLLLQEAKAAAKVAHPNVVPIFDVGVQNGRVYLAMEYVPGKTLRQTLLEPLERAQKIQWLMQAAMGLQAVHHTGLVHGDFKPENVLIDRNRTVRLLDFGLARGVSDAAPVRRRPGDAGYENGADQGLRGTPAYAAPELLVGEPLAPSCDIYALAVTAYETFCGSRPYAGSQFGDVRREIDRGPAWQQSSAFLKLDPKLRAIVARGLARDPKARFASAQAFADALAELLPRSNGRDQMTAAGVSLALLISAAVPLLSADPNEMCAGKEQAIEALWSHDTSKLVHQLFASTGAADAELAASQVDSAMATWVHEWSEAYSESCQQSENTRAKAGASRTLDRQMLCLNQHLDKARTLVHSLTEQAPERLEKAVEIATSLERPSTCEDAATRPSVLTIAPEDPLYRAQVNTARAELERARTGFRLGADERAVAAQRAAESNAQAMSWTPLWLESMLLRSTHEIFRWNYRSAGRMSLLAQPVAVAWDDPHFQIEFTSRYVTAVSMVEQEGMEAASEGLRTAQAMESRFPGSGLLSVMLFSLSSANINNGNYLQARQHLLRLLSMINSGQETRFSLAPVKLNLSSVENNLANSPQAELYARDAIALYKTMPRPPRGMVLLAHANLSMALKEQGRIGEALRTLHESIDDSKSEALSSPLELLPSYHYLTLTLLEAYRLRDAWETSEIAIKLMQELVGRHHLRTADFHLIRARIAHLSGDPKRAQEELGLARAAVKHVGPTVDSPLAKVLTLSLASIDPTASIDAQQLEHALTILSPVERETFYLRQAWRQNNHLALEQRWQAWNRLVGRAGSFDQHELGARVALERHEMAAAAVHLQAIDRILALGNSQEDQRHWRYQMLQGQRALQEGRPDEARQLLLSAWQNCEHEQSDPADVAQLAFTVAQAHRLASDEAVQADQVQWATKGISWWQRSVQPENMHSTVALWQSRLPGTLDR